MITLTKLTHLNDGTYYATWRDDEGGIAFTFAAIHDANGRLVVCNMNLRPPRLTAAQIETAVCDQHPAYALAEKGAAAKPALAQRMQKAAALVEAGSVTLTGETSAMVGDYNITATACTCKDHEYRAPDGWCKHRLAVRMARALGQPIDFDAMEREIKARKQRDHEAMVMRVRQQGHANRRSYRDYCNNSPEAARRYLLKAAANGRIAAQSGGKLHRKQQQATRRTTTQADRAYWIQKTRDSRDAFMQKEVEL